MGQPHKGPLRLSSPGKLGLSLAIHKFLRPLVGWRGEDEAGWERRLDKRHKSGGDQGGDQRLHICPAFYFEVRVIAGPQDGVRPATRGMVCPSAINSGGDWCTARWQYLASGLVSRSLPTMEFRRRTRVGREA